MSIPIDLKIDFLEILIRSFSSLRNFTTGEQRQNWIRTDHGASFGDNLEGLFELYFDSINSREEAELKLNQLEQKKLNLSSSKSTTVEPSIIPITSFEAAMALLEEHGLIDMSRSSTSSVNLSQVLRCATNMKFQGRADQLDTAKMHIQDFAKTDEEAKKDDSRSPYLLAFGSSGSGKTRFLYEIGTDSYYKGYLVLACTFNNATPFVQFDDNDSHIPVGARLLYQYLRKDELITWRPWSEKLQELVEKYHFLNQLDAIKIIRLLKKLHSKEKAILLIDETHHYRRKSGQYSETDILTLMSSVMTIQDSGTAVIFSVFVPTLAQRDVSNSTRSISKLNMTNLSFEDLKSILNNSTNEKYLQSISNSLGLGHTDLTIDLLYNCLGGLPRIVEGLETRLASTSSFDLVSIIESVGRYVANKYIPPTFELIMAAFNNAQISPQDTFNINNTSFTLEQLKIYGYCQDPVDMNDQNYVILSEAQLFASVYSESSANQIYPEDLTLRNIFRQVLKDLLVIPRLRGHNIWEEFTRRIFILRSLRYSSRASIPLSELFRPAIEVNGCLSNTIINMEVVFTKSFRYILPPKPSDVNKTPSIWFPNNQFESGVDTLMFFKRSTDSSMNYEFKGDPEHIDNDPDNLICVGIQNKWYKDEQTTISYKDMRDAINHFKSKMKCLEWNDNQLFFIFIINQNIRHYVEPKLEDLFNEQVGIISSTGNMLAQWLSPTVKLMVQRFQILSKNYPDHVVFEHKRDDAEIEEYTKNEKTLYNQYKADDENNPNRSSYYCGKKRENEDANEKNNEKDKKMKISEDE